MEIEPFLDHPLILLNPAANRGKMELHRSLVRSKIDGEPKRYEYRETTRPGEITERAMQAARENRPVIIVGGDGSLHEAANGILASGTRVPLGIVPAGSGNDYACNTLKLPRDPAVAVERAFNGRLVDADAGCVNGHYFVNSCSIGLDADIAVTVGWMKKYPLMSGKRLYTLSAVLQLVLGYHRCPWLTFRLDGEQGSEVERQYMLMAITVGPTYGAGFRINPTADYADGLLDVCTIDWTPLPRALKLLPVVQRGEHANLPEVTFYRTQTVSIQSRQAVNIQMDGETTQVSRLNAHVLPGALWVRI